MSNLRWTEDRLYFSGANVKTSPLPWQLAGLAYTASGYGERIPTLYMVWNGKRWQRVYCCIFSNSGTCYIIRRGIKTVVDLDSPALPR